MPTGRRRFTAGSALSSTWGPARTTGAGLGLAIVSDIVEAYSGRLTLGDAEPGLMVTIFLPAVPAAPK